MSTGCDIMASMIVAFVLSFFIAGLGIAYAGNLTLGVGLILLWLMLCLISLYSVGTISIFVGAISLIIWICSLSATFFLPVKLKRD